MAQKINPADLIPLDIFESTEPIKIDLVYAQADHPRNIFGEALYLPTARLWAHKDLAAITILTARTLYQKYGWNLEIQDCLRTVDAQAAMGNTQIVKDNPQWCVDGPNRMVSPPGYGAHPRGMAIDVGPLDGNGNKVDMGTPFDDMCPESARTFESLSEEVLENRRKLETTFVESGKSLGFSILPIPPEWWDFRFLPEYTDGFTPLSDADLPPQMQMTNKIDNNIPGFDDEHFQRLADSIKALIEPFNENI